MVYPFFYKITKGGVITEYILITCYKTCIVYVLRTEYKSNGI